MKIYLSKLVNVFVIIAKHICQREQRTCKMCANSCIFLYIWKFVMFMHCAMVWKQVKMNHNFGQFVCWMHSSGSGQCAGPQKMSCLFSSQTVDCTLQNRSQGTFWYKLKWTYACTLYCIVYIAHSFCTWRCRSWTFQGKECDCCSGQTYCRHCYHTEVKYTQTANTCC